MMHGSTPLREARVNLYIDFTNFIERFNDFFGTEIFRRSDNRHIKLSKIVAQIVHNLFSSIPEKLKNLVYPYQPIPYRLYCYGSYYGGERSGYEVFKEEILNLGNTRLHFVLRGRGNPEKGIDTKIIVDMLIDTFNEYIKGFKEHTKTVEESMAEESGMEEDEYGESEVNYIMVTVLVSGDSDFVPALEAVRRYGRRVYILYFPYWVSDDLRDESDGFIELPVEDIIHPDLPSIILSYFKIEFLLKIKDNIVNKIKNDNNYRYLIKQDYINSLISEISTAIESEDLCRLHSSMNQFYSHLEENYLKYIEYINKKLYGRILYLSEIYYRTIEQHLKQINNMSC